MASTQPDILIVLPTLGQRVDMLAQALVSVDRQREDVALTLVVVVPQHAKEARALAKKHGATIVDDPGRGMSAAINAGLSMRTTEKFYIWLGDDDQYRLGGLLTLSTLLQTHPQAVVAYGACDYIDDAGRTVWTSQAGSLATVMIRVGPNLIPHPAAMMRLDALEQVGGYDEELSLVMDLDLLLRLKKVGRFVSTTTVVSAFGWHPGSITVSDRKTSGKEARMVKRRALPRWLRPLEPLWEYPVAWASQLAAHALNRRQNPATKH